MTLHEVIAALAAIEVPNEVISAEIDVYGGRQIHVSSYKTVEELGPHEWTEHGDTERKNDKITTKVGTVTVFALLNKKHNRGKEV